MQSYLNRAPKDADLPVDMLEIERHARQLRAYTLQQWAARSAAALRRVFAQMTGRAAHI